MSGADDAAPRPLKLFAGDVEDLSVISAMVTVQVVPDSASVSSKAAPTSSS